MKKKKQLYKKRFLQISALIALILGGIRQCVPSVMDHRNPQNDSIQAFSDSLAIIQDSLRHVNIAGEGGLRIDTKTEDESTKNKAEDKKDTTAKNTKDNAYRATPVPQGPKSIPSMPAMNGAKHKIYSVSSYEECFPDSQSVQLESAIMHGLSPIDTRDQIDKYKGRLVYAGACPYYALDSHMESSVPYLVPRANKLLQLIGKNFLDSLAIKHIPLHRIIVTSIYRTRQDVDNLSRGNNNATSNSCHSYATTFDITYNNYSTVQHPDGPQRRAVSNDTLKFVLSEVLHDLRQQGKCHVKYEIKQPCYHITVR